MTWIIYKPYAKGKASGPPDNAMSFSEIQSLDSLSFAIQIFVHRIVLKKDNLVFYERDIMASHQSAVWRIQSRLLEKFKSAHIGKLFCSEIYGGMYCCYMQRNESHFSFYLRLCALPKGKREVDLSWTVEKIIVGDGFETKASNSYSKGLTIQGSGANNWGNTDMIAMDDLMKSNSLIFNISITVTDDQKALDHWNQLAQRQDNDDEKNESNILNVQKTDSNEQSEERFNLMKARIDSLESAMESVTSSKRTDADQNAVKFNQTNKQLLLHDQAVKTLQSDVEQMKRRITSIDSKLKEIQKRTDGKFRRQSESNQSQSVEIFAMMNQLKEEMAALKEAQNQGDEELKEETEEMKLKKWMEDEVKLPQYFELLKEDGFDDLESVLDVTEDDLKAMGIDKTGHRRKILKFVTKLKAKNNPQDSIPSSMVQQGHVPVAAAAYSFAVAQSAKVDAEGPNLVDTGH